MEEDRACPSAPDPSLAQAQVLLTQSEDVWTCLDMQMLQEELDSMLQDREETGSNPCRTREDLPLEQVKEIVGEAVGNDDPTQMEPIIPPSPEIKQWPSPDTPTEIPTPNTDVSSADELDSGGWTSQDTDCDWTVNPLSDQQPSLKDTRLKEGWETQIPLGSLVGHSFSPSLGLGNVSNQVGQSDITGCDWSSPDGEESVTLTLEGEGPACNPKEHTERQPGESAEGLEGDGQEVGTEPSAVDGQPLGSAESSVPTESSGIQLLSVEIHPEFTEDGFISPRCISQNEVCTSTLKEYNPVVEGGGKGLLSLACNVKWAEALASLGQEEERRETPARPGSDAAATQTDMGMQTQPTESDIAELTKLLEDIEEFRQLTEHSKQSEQSKQPEQTIQWGETVQKEQIELLEESEETKQVEQIETKESVQIERVQQFKDLEQIVGVQLPEESMQEVELKLLEGFIQTEEVRQLEESEQTVQEKQLKDSDQTYQVQQLEESGHTKQLQPLEESKQTEQLEQVEESEQTKLVQLLEESEWKIQLEFLDEFIQIEQPEEQTQQAEPTANDAGMDREGARRLAERLYKLQDVRRTEVVQHMDKANEFSKTVGEEYLKFFDFTGQSLDQALRSFLKVVVLIGETQERERVLQHFAGRFHNCNPDRFSSSGAVLTLTCALMLLNTDLHGQNVGKPMSSSSFVSNLDGMNEGQNFPKEMLKGLYSSIKSEPLEWAVGEQELKNSTLLPGDAKTDAPARSRSNPFQDIPHDEGAAVFKQGFLTRKAHADIDGKRTPWGKRSWKTFYAVLKGLVLYLQKDQNSMDWQSAEEVISVHHSLAEPAVNYTKRPHVFRLQTADWRVYLLQSASTEQMSSWISRINLVSALYSSPPLPAGVGSQRRFSRPILPAKPSQLTLENKLQSHSRMLQSFSEDLKLLQQGLPDGRRAKPRELEEQRQREEYLQHEITRYEVYMQMLEVWQALGGEVGGPVRADELELFDTEVAIDVGEEHEETGLKKSYSSPSLDQDMAPPTVVKIKRNISERHTYRKVIVPRRNRDV
ncbi:hypothetical protein AGOR_G00012190 [Albula goreensis]|uniref:PH and SEC7 domain-containing protein 4-like n=1 Tax=Albula goreensis TaxID=1534307 RepID=A0A8T3E9T1_9TELE|nr:hypothetical protein AGOR_G00012190 [Albula goreensis]